MVDVMVDLVRCTGVVQGLLAELVEMLVVGGCRGGGLGLCGWCRLYGEWHLRVLHRNFGCAGDEVVAGVLLF